MVAELQAMEGSYLVARLRSMEKIHDKLQSAARICTLEL
jgi:hypothetical protein